jgi:cell division protein FtsI/penicillin-binding protein 2
VSARPTSARFETRISRGLAAFIGSRIGIVVIGVLLIAGVGIGGHMYGRQLARGDTQERDAAIIQLRTDVQKLDGQITDQNGKLAALQTKLTSVQATLEAIMPSANTYTIQPNQSVIAADGRLTVGLVGPPTNEGINVNINGKQQLIAAGDVVHLAPDSSTSCQVEVQSFDMFKAIVTASCTAAKHQ